MHSHQNKKQDSGLMCMTCILSWVDDLDILQDKGYIHNQVLCNIYSLYLLQFTTIVLLEYYMGILDFPIVST